ncbi:Domain of unknown function DUF23 domain-containing protein [Strongyloides ratti]|uniref:Glycosyltransferase family 92 protein n=1 Tax=Strongyloides ratti TaxID=34506 RepID=A0A090LCF6_STRRB|nr:Domain of unknown function DUF23 domain-containing protein [Strongyloides ratti]CEF65793.1 Domain of unknown function DUF23 domain-containing protein [Strongyloides ratti]
MRKGSLFEIEDKISTKKNNKFIKKDLNCESNKSVEKEKIATIKPFKILMETPNDKYIPMVAFVKRAFLILNNTIEVPLITTNSFITNNKLYLKEGNITGKIQCQWGPKCPEYYTRGCIITGYIATFKLPSTNEFLLNNLSLNTFNNIHLTSKTFNDLYTIPLYNSFSPITLKQTFVYKHFLAVFVQPMYYMSDFHVIIQFFEYWISQGATKIYIARTSNTKEVETIIKWYNDNKWIETEFIEWPILPNIYRERSTLFNKYNQEFNPNLYTFQYEAILSIYDAMLYIRSLKESKYVAVFDWDEIIVIHDNNTTNIKEFLKKNENNDYVAWSFESRRLMIKNNFSVNTLDDISFLSYGDAIMDIKPFKRPAYQKNIYRPEFIHRFHVHLIQKTIKSKNINYVNNKIGEIYHLRRIPDIEVKFNTIRTNILQESGQIWTQNFKMRLQIDSSITKNKTWNNYFDKIARKLENCRQETFKENFSHKYNLCVSVEACSKYLKLNEQLDWITSKEKWIVIK